MLAYLNKLGLFGWMLTLLGFIVLITVAKWLAVLVLVIFIIVSIIKCWEGITKVTNNVTNFIKSGKQTKGNK